MVLFEIFITLAIAGVMMALLIPAIGAARAAAARSQAGDSVQTWAPKRLLFVGAGVTIAGLTMIPLSGAGSAEGTGVLETSFVPQSTAEATFDVENATITMVFHEDGTVEWDSRVDVRVQGQGCVFGSASIRKGTGSWADGGSEASGDFRHRTRVDVREGPCEPTPERDLAGRDLQWELMVDPSSGVGAGTLHDVPPEGTGGLDIPFDVEFPAGAIDAFAGIRVPSRWLAGTVTGIGAAGAGSGAALNWRLVRWDRSRHDRRWVEGEEQD